jgi:hypothetical protein
MPRDARNTQGCAKPLENRQNRRLDETEKTW